MEAYANSENPEDVPKELVKKGYGSFVIPPLNEGIFYGGKANSSMGSGSLFPQPTLIKDGLIISRKDDLFGEGFSIVSKNAIKLNKEEEDFYKKLLTRIVILDEELINQNHWLSSYMEMGNIFIVRPDRYIFGASSDKVAFQDTTNDLRIRLGMD